MVQLFGFFADWEQNAKKDEMGILSLIINKNVKTAVSVPRMDDQWNGDVITRWYE